MNAWLHWKESSERPPNGWSWIKWGGSSCRITWLNLLGWRKRSSSLADWENLKSGIPNAALWPRRRTRLWPQRWCRRSIYEFDSISGGRIKSSGHQGPTESLQDGAAKPSSEVRRGEGGGESSCASASSRASGFGCVSPGGSTKARTTNSGKDANE